MRKAASEVGNFCPLLKGPCVENKCMWWTRVIGKDVNTGEDHDHWGCAVTWMPVLFIEGANQTRAAGAAIESLRNNLVKRLPKPQTKQLGHDGEIIDITPDKTRG